MESFGTSLRSSTRAPNNYSATDTDKSRSILLHVTPATELPPWLEPPLPTAPPPAE